MERKFICNSTEPIVQTKNGKIRGYYLDGTYTFHGIRYANAKRFKMPTPVKPWDGVKDALNYGPIAPLLAPFDINTEILMPHRLWPESENCQYLNIWSQNISPSIKKPVMVWLHGGGYSAGSSIEQVAYDGDNLSRFGDVVVVTLNHRLNILGYLDLSAFGKQYANSGNLGMSDIVESLKWIQENISAFGGDPNNVTIFGQSGGGGKVISLCQIPSTEGLFHKAIIMSGIFNMNFPIKHNDKDIISEMLKELGITLKDIHKLETLPFRKLANAYRKAGSVLGIQNISMRLSPTPNDWYLGDPLKVGFSKNFKKIPIIAGTVISEFSSNQSIPEKNELSSKVRREILTKKYGKATDKLIQLFKNAYPSKNEIDLLTMDAQFRVPTLQFLEKKSSVSNAPVYSYMFSLEFDYDDGKPAWHCSDIPFAFHNTELVPICNIDGVTEKLEKQFCGSFVNFAKTGNPNHSSLSQWSPFTPDNKTTMVFDRISKMKINFENELMELLQKVTSPTQTNNNE